MRLYFVLCVMWFVVVPNVVKSLSDARKRLTTPCYVMITFKYEIMLCKAFVNLRQNWWRFKSHLCNSEFYAEFRNVLIKAG